MGNCVRLSSATGVDRGRERQRDRCALHQGCAIRGPAGNRLPQIPANKQSAFAQYTVPFGASLDGFARVDFEHTGLFYNNGDNTLSSGGYSLVNVRAGVDLGKTGD